MGPGEYIIRRAGVCGVGSKFPRGKTVRKRNKKGFCDIFGHSVDMPEAVNLAYIHPPKDKYDSVTLKSVN